MAELYLKLGRASANRRAWKRYLGYAIFAGAVVGSVACGWVIGWAAAVTWGAL